MPRIKEKNRYNVSFNVIYKRNHYQLIMTLSASDRKWQKLLENKIDRLLWDAENERFIEKSIRYKALNSEINTRRNAIHEIAATLKLDGKSLTIDKFKTLLHFKGSFLFNDAFLEYNNLRSRHVSWKTVNKERGYKVLIDEYIKKEYKQNDIGIDQVNTIRFISGLYNFLRHHKNYAYDHVRKGIGMCKSIVKHFVLKEILDSSKIDIYKAERFGVQKPISSLTLEEVKSIAELNIKNQYLKHAKNMFLLQCYTGLAYVDLVGLKEDHIKEIDGKKWIVKSRLKSGVLSYIPLNKKATQILIYFSGPGHKIISCKNTTTSDGLIPCLSNQTYNRFLKEIGALSSIETRLTSHIARKTFACIILNKTNVSLETVSAMLGHTNIRITQKNYAEIKRIKVAREMADVKVFT